MLTHAYRPWRTAHIGLILPALHTYSLHSLTVIFAVFLAACTLFALELAAIALEQPCAAESDSRQTVT